MLELPKGYYLTNFLELVDYVFEQYGDLLNQAETNFYHRFHSLTRDSQYLYLRMLTRKGLVFRQTKLNYTEIQNIESATQELQSSGFITINPSLPVTDFLHLMSKPEWLKILAKLEINEETQTPIAKLPRAKLNELLINLDAEFDFYNLVEEPILLLIDSELFDTYKLLFFGNLHQDLTEFVLRDLGLFRFEPYHIDKNSRLFSSRQQIDNYLVFYKSTEGIEQVLQQCPDDIIAFHQRLPKATFDDDTLNRRIQRSNLTLARQLERLQSLRAALSIYRQCKREPSRERQSRILVKLDKIEDALELCKQIIAKPLSESEKRFAKEFGYRTAKKYQLGWQKPVTYKPVTETIRIEKTSHNVEIAAANYLAKFGKCFYIENGLFLSVFGLHFWNVLFAPVKGAFTNPFQYRPHDLYDDNFLDQRASEYQQSIEKLANLDQNLPHYLNLAKEKSGIATPFVFWQIIKEDLLKMAFKQIPVKHWQAIFSRIWSDIRANRSGFPDLILFPESGGYQLIEIKGPGDKLQKNQQRWMSYFAEHNIPHKVVHVEWQ